MKKIAKCMSIVLMVLALIINLSGCAREASHSGGYDSSKTYRGTVKVKIFNNTTVPLTVEDVSNTYGHYTTETTIAAGDNQTIEVQCSCTGGYGNYSDAYIMSTSIKAYYVSGSTIAYPFAGTVSDGVVSKESGNKKANGNYSYFHETLICNSDGTETVTLTLNFVKTIDDEYVLARVQ